VTKPEDYAEKEYNRLCQLIGGKPPFGDCQLIALMIHRAVPNSEIIQGQVGFEDGDSVEHFWVRSLDIDLDPLSKDWFRTSTERVIERIVAADEIFREYRGFAEFFSDDNPYTLFPLRYKLRPELLTGD
jgi:hypothetical protein